MARKIKWISEIMDDPNAPIELKGYIDLCAGKGVKAKEIVNAINRIIDTFPEWRNDLMVNRKLKINEQYKYGLFIEDKMCNETVIWFETEEEATNAYEVEVANIEKNIGLTQDRETVAIVQVLEMQDVIYEPSPRDLWKQSIGKS